MEKNAANNSASSKNSPPPPPANSPPHTPTHELDTTIETNPTNEPSEKIMNETNPTNEPSEKIMNNETNPTNEASKKVIKTVEEVMSELSGGDVDEASEHWRDGIKEDDWDTDEEDDGGEDGHVSKKRKLNDQVRDPPAGKPTCPECKKEFATWKAAFGHMRKHPNRAHRGFFPPPTFTTAAPVAEIHDAEDDGDNNVGEGLAAVVREIVADLNRSIGAPGSSADGSGGSGGNQEAPPPAENEEGGMFKDFDLNEMPPADDDDAEEN